jgi:hypothetical protein
VKVCDICGDVGEEEKLAVCSRCNDGAEHVYGFVYFIAFFQYWSFLVDSYHITMVKVKLLVF